VLAQPDVQRLLARRDVVWQHARRARGLPARELAKWAKIVKDSGAKVD
jgi:hypothetical protein